MTSQPIMQPANDLGDRRRAIINPNAKAEADAAVAAARERWKALWRSIA